MGRKISARIEYGMLVIRIPLRAEIAAPGPAERLRRVRDRLTRREREVLQGIQRDLANKEIAGQLCISESAVKHHVRNLLRKTGCATRREVTREFGWKN